MQKEHHYQTAIQWTGNNGTGTSNYTAYDRSYTVSIANKATIAGSSDPAFRGDSSKHNPEELLVASLSSCHMLWYLHLCSEAGIIVTAYEDNAIGVMLETKDGSGFFQEVILNPKVTVENETMIPKALELHQRANEMCFIAKSVNFPVHHSPEVSMY